MAINEPQAEHQLESMTEAAADAIRSAHPGMPMKALWTALTDDEPLAVVVALVKDERCGLERRSQRHEGEMAYRDNSVDNDATPLLLAALANRSDVATSLIADGADVTAVAIDRSTALHYATALGNVDLVKQLMIRGADIQAENMYGRNAIQCNADANCIRMLVEDGGLPIDNTDDNGRTALFTASMIENHEATRMLIELGACVNCADSEGWTPLVAAASEGNTEAIVFLSDAGADMNQRDDDGGTPLNYATYYGHAETVRALIRLGGCIRPAHSDGWPTIYGSNSPDVVEAFIAEGWDVNSDHNGVTMLQYAALTGRLTIVKVLVKLGADLALSQLDGTSALHLAATSGHSEIIRTLVRCGASMLVVDANKDTPLHHAALSGHCDAVDALVEFGADLNPQNFVNETPLHHACRNLYVRTSETLISLGANAELFDIRGDTALHIAVQQGSLEVVRSLLSVGVSANLFDKFGCTTLSHAVKRDHLEITQLLVRFGGDPTIPTTYQDQMGTGEPAIYTAAVDPTKQHFLRLFLEAGANPNVNNYMEQSLLDAARTNEACVSILLEYGADPGLCIGSVPTDAMLDCGADWEAALLTAFYSQDYDFLTQYSNSHEKLTGMGITDLLYNASCVGHMGLVQHLIACGVNPSEVGIWGSPLGGALYSGNSLVAEYLIERGADIEGMVPGHGWTLLHCACSRDMPSCIEGLLQRGVNVNDQNLFEAALNKGCVELLEDNGADLAHGRHTRL